MYESVCVRECVVCAYLCGGLGFIPCKLSGWSHFYHILLATASHRAALSFVVGMGKRVFLTERGGGLGQPSYLGDLCDP